MTVKIPIGYERTTKEPLDWLYNNGSSWSSVADANAGISPAVRYTGQLVFINTDIYIYKNGIADTDLIPYFPKKATGIKIFNYYNFI